MKKEDVRIQELGDEAHIEVAHCIHCEKLAICPMTDECPCGGELYPVSKLVPLGKMITIQDLYPKS